jgi:uncharacterized protein YndB with AHSA1/START domain
VSYDMKLERLIDATPEEVFDAFTDRDAMKEWYTLDAGWAADVAAYDPRVGGRTTVVFGGEQKFREDITYVEIGRPHRLVYEEDMRRVADGAGYVTRVSVTFEAQDGKTLLTLVQEGFHVAERRDAHEQGWPQFINRLEQVIAKRRAA